MNNWTIITAIFLLTLLTGSAYSAHYRVVTINSNEIVSAGMELYKCNGHRWPIIKAWGKLLRDNKGEVNLRTYTVKVEKDDIRFDGIKLSDGRTYTELPTKTYEIDLFGVKATILRTLDAPNMSAICSPDPKLTSGWLLSLGHAFNKARQVLTEDLFGATGTRYKWLQMMATRFSAHLYESTNFKFRMSDEKRLKAVRTFLLEHKKTLLANKGYVYRRFANRVSEIETKGDLFFRDGSVMSLDAVKLLHEIINTSESDVQQQKESQSLRESLDILNIRAGQ